MSAFRTWNGVERHTLFPGVAIHAIGGEQVMWIVDGDVTMTVGDETKTLGAGDVVVVNRGIEHELYSENGVTFFEALAPVPLDHVPDKERDLFLSEGGATHVER